MAGRCGAAGDREGVRRRRQQERHLGRLARELRRPRRRRHPAARTRERCGGGAAVPAGSRQAAAQPGRPLRPRRRAREGGPTAPVAGRLRWRAAGQTRSTSRRSTTSGSRSSTAMAVVAIYYLRRVDPAAGPIRRPHWLHLGLISYGYPSCAPLRSWSSSARSCSSRGSAGASLLSSWSSVRATHLTKTHGSTTTG